MIVMFSDAIFYPQSKVRRVRGITVVSARSGLLLDPADNEFAHVVSTVLARGDRKVVVDLQHVLFATTVVIGAFAWAQTDAKKHGGRLILAMPHSCGVYRFLETYALTRSFEIRETTQEAIKELSAWDPMTHRGTGR